MPTPQGVQEDAATAEDVPALQATHTDEETATMPVAAEAVPARQDVQVAA